MVLIDTRYNKRDSAVMRFSPAVFAWLLLAAPAGAAGPVLSPAPGTPDASTGTQISIYGVKPRAIGTVAVTGAQSGPHAGALRPYSRRDGASFVPDTPFAAGERVTVTARVAGARRRWSFTVATPPATLPPILTLDRRQDDKLQHFVSAPDVLAPEITVRRHGGSASSILLTPLPSPVVHPGSATTITIDPVGPGGPMIADRRGRLVWFRPLTPPDVAANLRVQRYRSKRVLTWWEGPVTAAAYGLGTAVLADSAYRTVRRVHAGNGYAMDLHEFTLTKRGTALFPIYTPVMTTVGGKEQPVLDSIVQEVDVETGLVVWEWHALGNVPLEESYASPENSAYYDAFHINSIQDLPSGRVLVSMRNASAVYKIRRAGGRIDWTLGGRASDFRLRRDAAFWLQHNALLRGRRLTLFDDQAGPPQKRARSRGLVLRLDERRMRATRVLSLDRPGKTSAQSEGSVQRLPGGGWFVGYGSEPWFTEFSAAGRLRFDARLPADDGSYRIVRHRWNAAPGTKPVVTVRDGVAYVSWNGATEVARWRVLAGPAAGRLKLVRTVARRGFETRIAVPGAAVVAVAALDRRGRVLATSEPAS